MNIKKALEYLKFKKEVPTLKKYITIFILVLIPQFLRQISYYVGMKEIGSIGFIVSFETVKMYSTGLPILGFIEEIGIGLLFITLWFVFERMRFLTYAWVSDALFDMISVITFFVVGATPLQLLGFGEITRFLLREVILFFGIVGPLLYIKGVNIKKYSMAVTAIGIGIILIILL